MKLWRYVTWWWFIFSVTTLRCRNCWGKREVRSGLAILKPRGGGVKVSSPRNNMPSLSACYTFTQFCIAGLHPKNPKCTKLLAYRRSPRTLPWISSSGFELTVPTQRWFHSNATGHSDLSVLTHTALCIINRYTTSDQVSQRTASRGFVVSRVSFLPYMLLWKRHVCRLGVRNTTQQRCLSFHI